MYGARRVMYWTLGVSVAACLALATAKAPASVVAALLQEGEEDPNDLIALDAARQ
jgi:hypothetical protein